ncbi:FAD-dependent monooxygenase [Sorangium sp. So ce1078]|uniref:FAD-dependent monooxygenase n=1 Tax=Sorangium sp. So ce1078 TaxID=3133329 RepID=UPI003F5DBC9C
MPAAPLEDLMEAARFDVVVLGGGPAGMAAALTLAHHGALSVAVLEKSDYDAPRIGETLSPGVVGLLHYLKVWDAFVAAGHQSTFGTSAAWGSDAVASRDYLFTPFGPGWHLDRTRFDALLSDSAARAGAAVWRGARLAHAQRTSDGWELDVAQRDTPRRVRARFVVDATGKAAIFAKRRGVKRWSFDRQIGAAGVFRFPGGVPDDTFTLVEAVETGWWYSAKLPGGALIVALMTDADIANRLGVREPAAWLEALEGAAHTRRRLSGGSLEGGVRIVPAHSSRLDRTVGDCWIAVGDAAASHDPLSASGIPRALDSGIHAARAVHSFLGRGDRALLAWYEAHIRQSFESYCATRASYYRLERRWPASPFWRRRRQEVALDPRALVRWRAEVEPAEAFSTASQDLALRDYALLRDLSLTPRPAHEVVAELKRRSGSALCDQRIILALQELTTRGIVDIAAAAADGGGDRVA